MNKNLDSLFDFVDRDESFASGILFMMAVNVCIIIFFLLTYFVAYTFGFSVVAILYFMWLILNFGIFGSQCYAMMLSGVTKTRIRAMDWGATFSSLLCIALLLMLINYKFGLFPVTEKSQQIVTLGGFFMLMVMAHAPVVNLPSVIGIGFTSDQAQANGKTFYIKKKKLMVCRAAYYLLIIALAAAWLAWTGR